MQICRLLFHQIEHRIHPDMPIGGQVIIQAKSLKDFIHIDLLDLLRA